MCMSLPAPLQNGPRAKSRLGEKILSADARILDGGLAAVAEDVRVSMFTSAENQETKNPLKRLLIHKSEPV